MTAAKNLGLYKAAMSASADLRQCRVATHLCECRSIQTSLGRGELISHSAQALRRCVPDRAAHTWTKPKSSLGELDNPDVGLTPLPKSHMQIRQHHFVLEVHGLCTASCKRQVRRAIAETMTQNREREWNVFLNKQGRWLLAIHRRSESLELRGLVACLLECKHLAE